MCTQAARTAGVLDWCARPMNVTDFMNPWLLQRGFPVITIESTPKATVLTQRPYNPRSELPPNAYGYEWPVPVWYIRSGDGAEVLGWVVPQSAFDALSVGVLRGVQKWRHRVEARPVRCPCPRAHLS
jgi:aminopeptidase N